MTIICRTEKVEFRDGTSLVVAEENWLTGVTLLRLQREATEKLNTSDSIERQYFQVATYPKLVAAVVEGIPPKMEDAILMPSSEMSKWYDAVAKLNPHWFPENKEEAPVAETEKKRKPRKRK